jgi:uncharacterized protein (DUF362 family)/NAD-dependent dihydropyrimidine dehydrogenase PreA subunit
VPKVALVRCEAYDLESVRRALTLALDSIGGLAAFISPGDRVLLKVSMLRAAPPEQAVTTHPTVAVALGLMVKELGAVPVIGDSCGGADYGLSEKALVTTGIKPLADEHDIETVLFETAGSEIVTVENEVHLKQIQVSKAVLDADKIISVAKLKTHMETLMTVGVKNMLGCLPGAGKLIVHKTAPSPEDLGQALLDIYSAVRPTLTVIDGILAMGGNGPSRGIPMQVGALLASSDAVAADHVAARLIGYDPKLIPTIAPAKARGLGENDENEIEIVGESLKAMKPAEFKLCSNAAMRAAPKWLLKFLHRRFFNVRPVWNKDGCTACGLCEKSCPVGAIKLENEIITLDRDTCIECFCCFELCPEHGYKVKKSLLAKILS